MFAFQIAETGAADVTWASAAAGRSLRTAVDELDGARASMVALLVDTEWSSDGVRALHDLLIEVQRGIAATLSTLDARAAELAVIAAS